MYTGNFIFLCLNKRFTIIEEFGIISGTKFYIFTERRCPVANYYDNEKFFNGYMIIRSQKMNYNNCIEEPLMLKLIGNTEGKDILDIGCGSGDLSSILAKTANSVLGIDISQKMLNTAREKNISNNIRYQELSMENIDSLSEKFDIAVSSLAFHYVENFEKLILDISKLLRKRGSLIFSQEHPMVTANRQLKDWICDPETKSRYWPVSNYNEEGERFEKWFIDNVKKYHRTLSTIINTIIKNNFKILEIAESRADDELISKEPKFLNGKNLAHFLFIKARKL